MSTGLGQSFDLAVVPLTEKFLSLRFRGVVNVADILVSHNVTRTNTNAGIGIQTPITLFHAPSQALSDTHNSRRSVVRTC